MGKSRGAYRVLLAKSEGTRQLGRPSRRWENNIKIDLHEVRWVSMDWIDLALDRDRWQAVVDTVMNFRFS
jgi:hypothetical protein